MSDNRYDLVVLGATGFTGQFVLEEVARKAEGSNITYAAAARNKTKLEKFIEQSKSNTGLDMNGCQIIIADVNDEESLLAMAKKAKVVINCVGPYRFYGERIVSACIEGGANHVDISGEPQYLERMQLEYNDKAKAAGVHVVGACGFDSVPADMGTIFLQDSFTGDVNDVEMVVGMHDTSEGSATTNVTTLECAVEGFRHKNELGKIRRQLFVNPLPKSPYRGKKRGNLWYSDEARRWCLPNMASDRSVVLRSQRLNYELENRQPCQFSAYFGMQSIFSAFGGFLFGFVFMIMTAFAWTSNLLVNHPSIFTFGAFSKHGAKREDLKNIKFCVTLTGRGWDTKLTESEETHSEAPKITKTVEVVGPDPGYFGTAILITACALTVLQEKDMLPKGGGVYPPGAAFLKTSLIKSLEKRGITFTLKN